MASKILAAFDHPVIRAARGYSLRCNSGHSPGTDQPTDFQRGVQQPPPHGPPKGKRCGRLRCERVERSFAHVCDTGGSRRSWLRQLEEVTKRYRIAAAAHNLARIMRLLFGIGKPRVLQAPADLVWLVHITVIVTWRWLATAAQRWTSTPAVRSRRHHVDRPPAKSLS